MDHHVAHAGGLSVAVQDLVVEDLVAEEESGDNAEAHGGEIDGGEVDALFKIGGDGDDHLAEGKDDVEHGPLGQVAEIDLGGL